MTGSNRFDSILTKAEDNANLLIGVAVGFIVLVGLVLVLTQPIGSAKTDQPRDTGAATTTSASASPEPEDSAEPTPTPSNTTGVNSEIKLERDLAAAGFQWQDVGDSGPRQAWFSGYTNTTVTVFTDPAKPHEAAIQKITIPFEDGGLFCEFPKPPVSLAQLDNWMDRARQMAITREPSEPLETSKASCQLVKYDPQGGK